MATYEEDLLAMAEAVLAASGGSTAGLTFNEAMKAMAAKIIVDGVGGGGGGGGWAGAPLVAAWKSIYFEENASTSITDGTLTLGRVTVPVDLKLSGLSSRWSSGAAGDFAHNCIYLDANDNPGALFFSSQGAAMGTGDSWSSSTFAEIDWPAGDYWYGPLLQTNVPAATRALFFAKEGVSLAAWMTNTAGTGADPSSNIGNAGRAAVQTGIAAGAPNPFAGFQPNDGNSGKVPPAMWAKIRAA